MAYATTEWGGKPPRPLGPLRRRWSSRCRGRRQRPMVGHGSISPASARAPRGCLTMARGPTTWRSAAWFPAVDPT